MRTFNRRDLLKAAGASLVVPRFVGTAMAQSPAAPPPLILLMKVQAMTQGQFWPADNNVLSSPILDPLLKDTGLAPKTTLIKGLYNNEYGTGNIHDWGFSGLFSGYRTAGPGIIGNGISLDQTLKQKTDLQAPFPTINCGVWGHPSFRTHQNRLSFSFVAPKQQVPTEWDPYKLYASVFGSAAPSGAPVADPAAARAQSEARLRRKRSVLDSVSADLNALGKRLGPEQRKKLEVHLGSIREMEMRLSGAMAAGVTAPPPPVAASCSSAKPAVGGLTPKNEAQTPELTRLMFDFIATAVSCNMTRIVTFQFGRGGEHFFYGWLGVGYNAHDEVDHRDNGRDAAITAVSLKINRWYSEQFLYLAKALDRIPAAEGGTMLDRSLVVLGHDAATGTHGSSNIPVLFMGSGGGRLKKTGYVVDQGRQDYHRLGATLLTMMGLPSQGFGEQPSCGTLGGVSI